MCVFPGTCLCCSRINWSDVLHRVGAGAGREIQGITIQSVGEGRGVATSTTRCPRNLHFTLRLFGAQGIAPISLPSPLLRAGHVAAFLPARRAGLRPGLRPRPRRDASRDFKGFALSPVYGLTRAYSTLFGSFPTMENKFFFLLAARRATTGDTCCLSFLQARFRRGGGAACRTRRPSPWSVSSSDAK